MGGETKQMEHNDTLLTIAEISVALAGFATLASIIGRRADDESRNRDALRLQIMLEVTLENMAFALAPLPFIHSVPDPMIWRIASALRVILLVGNFTYSIRRARSQPMAFDQHWLTVSTLCLAAIGLLANAGNAFGLGGSQAFSLYLGGLVTSLVSSALLFLAVAGSLLRAHRP